MEAETSQIPVSLVSFDSLNIIINTEDSVSIIWGLIYKHKQSKSGEQKFL